MNEIEFIKKIAKLAKKDSSLICGIGDDTAVIKYTKQKSLLITTDMLIEDVHFKKEDSSLALLGTNPFFKAVGWKALACSISDIAAMAGIPKYAFISIGVPSPETGLQLFKGIKECADKFNVHISGGDTNYSKKIIISITLTGEADTKKIIYRNGARPNDMIFVTGKLGSSIKGKHLNFTPRVTEAGKLAKRYNLTSMIDISDGLANDITNIALASKVGIFIYDELIPLSKDAKSIKNALFDGEDFELLFTLSAKDAARLVKKGLGKTELTCIGEVVNKKEGINIVDKRGKVRPLRTKGYMHFK